MNLASSNAIEIEVLSADQLRKHCDCAALREVWKRQQRKEHPPQKQQRKEHPQEQPQKGCSQCIGCTAQRFEMFLVIKPWRKNAKSWQLIGVCKSCSERADLRQVVSRQMMVQFPRGVMIFFSNDPQQPVRLAS